MKKFVRVIYRIPKLILQFIWNLIWGLFKLALILALVGYGLIYYANNSQSTLATNINQAFRQVVTVPVMLKNQSPISQRQILSLSQMGQDGHKIQPASIFSLLMKPWSLHIRRLSQIGIIQVLLSLPLQMMPQKLTS